jgi:CRP-like cAMP-binding protein
MKLIGKRVQRFQTQVEALLCKSAPARVAHVLADLARRDGIADDDGVLIRLRLSQTDLGRLVGVRRETVNIILQDWRDKGWIEADRRSLRVRNMSVLQRVE